MSLTKADSYKKTKEQLRKEQKKKKLMFRLKMAVALIIIALIIIWIAWSAYTKVEESKPRASVTVDYTAFDEYLQLSLIHI